MQKLTLLNLSKEFKTWTRTVGVGRNENDLRFGQYVVNNYDVDHIFPKNLDNEFCNRDEAKVYSEESSSKAYELLYNFLNQYKNETQ